MSSADLIKVIGNTLEKYKAKNIVVDPVMVATSGAKLINDSAIETLKSVLLPIATIVTPNILEAEMLANIKISNEKDMEKAGEIIWNSYGCSVLVKGGHSVSDANDLLISNNTAKWFLGNRISNPNTHGTGCTLSSAIASNLAKGFSLEESVTRAKNYISKALAYMLNLGKGSGPLNHCFNLEDEFSKEAN